MNQEVKRIKQEDKKAMKKFVLLMVAALLVGVVAGMLTSMTEHFFAEDIGSVLNTFLREIILPYGMPVVTAVVFVAVLVLYGKAKKLFNAWDGEDEDVIERSEEYLSYAIWLTSINMIWIYFVFGASVSGGIWESVKQSNGDFTGVVWTIGFFILGMVVISIEQQKLVNLTKQINPEKRGSIFDTKFQKKWEESCDEAEKLQTYQCAFKAYNAVQMECIILWLVCLMGGFIWDFGILPIAIISIIWATMTTVYCMEAIKISKKGRN